MVRRLIPPLLALLYTGLATAVPSPSIQYLAKVNDITQDSRGFIWLSGHQGLTRFDSINSLTFSANSPDWKIPFSWSHELEPFEDKFIVSSENNGSWIFNPVTGEVEALDIKTNKSSHYHTIAFNGSIYVYSNLNVYKYDIATKVTKKIFNSGGTSFFVKTPNKLYMKVASKGMFVLEGDTFEQLSDKNIREIIAVNNLVVAVTTESIDVLEDKTIIQSLSINKPINGLTKENGTDNFFTIADSGEIKKYHAKTLSELPHDYGNTRRGRIKAAFHDNSNVLWLASSLGVTTLVESAIKNHSIVFDIPNNSNEVTVFKNELVIGSYGEGLHPFSENSTIFPDNINDFFTKKALRIMNVIVVDDLLYIATFDGVWQYSYTKRTLERLPFENNNKLLLNLFHLNGLLYIGTNNDGLMIYDINKNLIVDQISKKDGLLSNEIIDILAFDNGDVWMTSTHGASIYNRHTRTIKNMPRQGPGKFISLAYAENKIFAATLGDGIYIYDRQGTLLSITAKGIEFTYSTIINNEIWIGAAHGFYIINPATHQYNLMPNTERYSFSGESHVIEDKAYISHYGGVLEIPIQKPEHYNSKVYIGKHIVSGQPQLASKKINISSPSDVVTLELASLDFRPGQEKQFKYKVNEGSWNYLNGSHLTLTGLASGSYQVEVMATNSLGQWSTNSAFASIDVAYPWYWTLKMRILYAVSLSCLIILIAWTIYLRAQSLRKINIVLEEEFQKKGKHTMLTRRNIQQTLAFLNNGDIDFAKELLAQNLAELEVKTKIQEPDNLFGKTLDIALPYLGEYLHRKYHVNLSCELLDDIDTLEYELQANIYKIIYEAITCAILHGDGRNFQVTLQEFKDKLWLTITDDESSFSNFDSAITFNMSMYYIRQIANIYNATVSTFEPSNDSGSQIVLSFPLISARKARA